MRGPFPKHPKEIHVQIPDTPTKGVNWHGRLSFDKAQGFKGTLVAPYISFEAIRDTVSGGWNNFPRYTRCFFPDGTPATLIRPFINNQSINNFSSYEATITVPHLIKGLATDEPDKPLISGLSLHSDSIFTWYNYDALKTELKFNPLQFGLHSQVGPTLTGESDLFESIKISSYTTGSQDGRKHYAEAFSVVSFHANYRSLRSVSDCIQDANAIELLFNILNSQSIDIPKFHIFIDTSALDLSEKMQAKVEKTVDAEVIQSSKNIKPKELPFPRDRVFTRDFTGDYIFAAINRFVKSYGENSYAFRLYEIAKTNAVPLEEAFLCVIRAIESTSFDEDSRSVSAVPELIEISEVVSTHCSEDAKQFFKRRIASIPFSRPSLATTIDRILSPIDSIPVFSSTTGAKIAKIRGKLTHRAKSEQGNFYQVLYLTHYSLILAYEMHLLFSTGIPYELLIAALRKSEEYKWLLDLKIEDLD